MTERGKKKKKESRKLNPGLTAWVTRKDKLTVVDSKIKDNKVQTVIQPTSVIAELTPNEVSELMGHLYYKDKFPVM